MFDLTTATADQFDEFQDQEFVIISVSEPITLKLIEVKKLGSGEREGGAFSLLWQGPATPILSQEIHRISHPIIGEQEIFLVPVAEKDVGLQYEAVFT